MQNTVQHEFTREHLLTLEPEIMVDLMLLLNSKYEQVAEQIRILMAEKYKTRNERFVNSCQLLVFPSPSVIEVTSVESELPSPDTTAAPKPIKETVNSKPKKPGHTRNTKPELPHVSIPAPTLNSDSELLSCNHCGTNRIATRQILQSSRYCYVPASFIIEDLHSQVYECNSCNHSEPLIVKAPEVVCNGTASPSLLAHIAVSRETDHMPLNRLSNIYSRSGVELARSTLSDYNAQTASILKPLYGYMKDILLRSEIVATDDTPVKTLDRKKEKKIKLARIWAYIGDTKNPVTLVDFTEGRGRIGPLGFLKDYKGKLQGDCFSGNYAISAAIGTTLSACMAHARRYFIKAMLNDKQGSTEALAIFQSLYEIEKAAKELELTASDLKKMRQQESEPILTKFHEWMQKQYLTAQPKSSFQKALFYCINNWPALTEYINDGGLEIDNNRCEREMKYIAMGRKAWLFFGSDNGGRNHAIIISILATCRRHKIEPMAYLTDVIQRLTENPKANLEELLPYNWQQKYPKSQKKSANSSENNRNLISSCSKAA